MKSRLMATALLATMVMGVAIAAPKEGAPKKAARVYGTYAKLQDLSDTQREQIASLYAEMKERTKAIEAEYETKMQGVLTAEQKAAYQQIQDDAAARRRDMAKAAREKRNAEKAEKAEK